MAELKMNRHCIGSLNASSKEIASIIGRQWKRTKGTSVTPAPIYCVLIGIGAQGRLRHHDDTPMRMLSLRQQLTQAPPPPGRQ